MIAATHRVILKVMQRVACVQELQLVYTSI